MLPVLNLTYFYLFIAVFMSRWYGGYNCIKQKLSLPGRLPFLMFIISLTTSLLSYAVSHDFSKSHCQRSDWLNGMHLIRWTSIAICRLRCLIPWQIRSTCLRCSCPWDLLVQERIIWQATLFMCVRSTRLYSGVLTYSLPIMLYVLWGYASATDTAIAFLTSQGQALFGIFVPLGDAHCLVQTFYKDLLKLPYKMLSL